MENERKAMDIKTIEELVKEKYSVEFMLGNGAKAIVYYVRNKRDGKGYALKVSNDLDTLRKEGIYLKRAKHKAFPNFVEWLEGEQGYLVMEHINGRNLQEVLDVGILFSEREAVWVMLEILEGIAYLHNLNPPILFRDLKPSNILLEENGQVRIVDLGSAVEIDKKDKSSYSIRTGTFGYAAPEQFWQGMTPKPDWDVYAAGKILGYLLTGRNPAIPPYHVEEFYLKDRRVSENLREIIKRCLSEHAEARYHDAGELRRTLCMAKSAAKRKRFSFRKQKNEIDYKKCIWLSDYRRIF